MYDIGDTIWIRSELDCTTLQNNFTNTTDNYCDATFSFPLGCIQILDIKEKSFEGGIPKFEFISREGRVYNDRSIPSPDINNQAEYNKNNNLYQLEFGMVCNTIGMFYIGIKPGGGITKDHCDRAGLDNIILNEDRGQEIYIAFRHPQEVTESDLRNIFCFEVH